MKKIAFQLLISGTLLFAAACNNNEGAADQAKEQNEQKFEDDKKEADRDFAVEAASGSMMEIELGKLAATNASSAKVKEFGKMMVDDHTQAGQTLKDLATTKNITLPAAPGDEHQKHINDLKEKKGDDFDKAYIDLMVDDHKDDIDKFEKEAEKGDDPEIKAFAGNTLPTLKKHLEAAKSIKDAMK